MSWIENSLEETRRRENAQRQEAARRDERTRIEVEKYRLKLSKDLAKLVRRRTGKNFEISWPLLPYEGLEGPKPSHNEGIEVYGKIQVDGVWFGIADISRGSNSGYNPTRWIALAVIGKDVRTGADAFRMVKEYAGDSRFNGPGTIDLGQALRELGYLSGR